MKHIFIVNPTAGRIDKTDYIKSVLDERKDIDYEIYITKAQGDALLYAHDLCFGHPEEEYRFYACGGDGTMSEVVNGIYGADNASFTVYPCGSGNDFVKAVKGYDFTDVNALIDGCEEYIDLIKVNNKMCANIVNAGFDAAVSYNMTMFKNKKWIKSGEAAYKWALAYSLLKEMKHKAKIYVDDELVFDGKFLMTSACNGICCGGGFYFAPDAMINDGIIDQLIVKSISRFTLIKYVGIFKAGTYKNCKGLQKVISVHSCKKIKIVSDEELKYGYDGENALTKEIEMEMVPHAIRLCYPKKA